MEIWRWLAGDLVVRQRCERHAPRLITRVGARTRPVVIADVPPSEAWAMCWSCMMGHNDG